MLLASSMTTRLRPAFLTIAIIIADGFALLAQVPGAPPAPIAMFEVVSVKISDPARTSVAAMVPLIRPQPGGRLSAINAPLRTLVQVAYGVEDFQVAGGGPSWQMSQRFDIVAKAGNANATLPDMLPMLRALLADRFKLRVHTEMREMATSALVVDRSDRTLGPNLAPSTIDCSNAAADARKGTAQVPCGVRPFGENGGFGISGKGQPIAVLARLLSQIVGNVVQDKTGLIGLYDFELSFDPAIFMNRAAQAGVSLPAGVSPPPTDSPALLTALHEQLGLELERQRSPVQVIVIDSADMPVPD
jgi:uncharacterized protein (TIGR03435 family)